MQHCVSCDLKRFSLLECLRLADFDEETLFEDADWDTFPQAIESCLTMSDLFCEVATALDRLGDREEKITIALSPSRLLWSIGVGKGRKTSCDAKGAAHAQRQVLPVRRQSWP